MSKNELTVIVREAMDGKEGAFERLVEAKGRDILYISIRLMGNLQDGEDTAQEILLYMQEHIQELRHAEAFNVWLYRMIRGTCAYMKRKNNKEWLSSEEHELDIPEERMDFLPHQFIEDNTKREKLMEIIDELDYQEKMCIYLFYFERMKYKQIGRVLEIKSKDVDNALMKAKRYIRKEIGKMYNKEDVKTGVYSLMTLPMFAKLLQEDMKDIMPEESFRKIANGCKEAAAGLGGSAGIGAGQALIGDTLAKGSAAGPAGTAGLGIKGIVGIAISLGVTAGAAGYMVNQQMHKDVEPLKAEQPETAAVFEDEEVYHEEEYRETAEEVEEEAEEKDIHTLSDMIGEEQEQKVKALAGRSDISQAELEQFLQENELDIEESVWAMKKNQQDSLYILEEQDKVFMVITRYEKDIGNYGLVYRFTGSSDKKPEALEIAECYERW